MATVVFVHGTGVREPVYSQVFARVESALHARRPDVPVRPCCWGTPLGAKLHAGGASIPEFDTTLGLGEPEDEEVEIALWEQLYRDPLYELRALALLAGGSADFVPGQVSPGEELDERVRSLTPSPGLRALLEEAGIVPCFGEARSIVVRSQPYRQALHGAASPAQYRDAVARALLAEAMACSEREEREAAVLTDAGLRDRLVRCLAAELGDADLAVGPWVARQLFGLAVATGAMDRLMRLRRALMDATHPFTGDVLLYQASGARIREFIREAVHQAEPPVVLLAHSLGGVACVDLLVREALPSVSLLVTAGSQAPFLYEINALSSLRYGEPLPDRFPRWLNIYDRRDLLSYAGEGIFPRRLRDVQVDSRQPFPRAHSSYWATPATWEAIVREIP
jgi:hypothetical protein